MRCSLGVQPWGAALGCSLGMQSPPGEKKPPELSGKAEAGPAHHRERRPPPPRPRPGGSGGAPAKHRSKQAPPKKSTGAQGPGLGGGPLPSSVLRRTEARNTKTSTTGGIGLPLPRSLGLYTSAGSTLPVPGSTKLVQYSPPHTQSCTSCQLSPSQYRTVHKQYHLVTPLT